MYEWECEEHPGVLSLLHGINIERLGTTDELPIISICLSLTRKCG